VKLTDFGLAGSMVERKEVVAKPFASPGASSRQLDPSLIAEMARASRARHDEPTASTDDVSIESSETDREMSNHEPCKCQDKRLKNDVRWVRRRTVCGTAGYRPPEQVQERFLDYFSRNGYDERADWFSLGVCCYTMLTGRRPFPTKKELFQSDSQRNFVVDKRLPSTVDDAILDKIMNDAEYRCLMFEVQYPSYFLGELHAKSFIDALLERDPEARPRYDGIVQHPWMKQETFEEESIMKRSIPDWVQDHAYLQCIQNESSFSLGGSPKIRKKRLARTLSECVDAMCNECFEKHESIYAENFAIKWTTKARQRTIGLFRHWNYMSDEVMKYEISAANTTPSKSKTDSFSERLKASLSRQGSQHSG